MNAGEKAHHQNVAGSLRGTQVMSPHVQEFSLKVLSSRMGKFKLCLSQRLLGVHLWFSVLSWITVVETHWQQFWQQRTPAG